jgi:hypothetical protein
MWQFIYNKNRRQKYDRIHSKFYLLSREELAEEIIRLPLLWELLLKVRK